MDLGTFWMIFTVAFTVALSGACSPGPLLTYTIMKSVQHPTHGYMMGLLIITGHAILETAIIILLLLGFSFILKNHIVIMIIGVSGGLILLYMGASIIYNVIRGKISTDFLDKEKIESSKAVKSFQAFDNPIIGGIMVSLSNPYWWIWWATLGFALMIKYNISFENPMGLLAFFAGHEAGDLAWYVPVSILAFMGRKKLNKTAYYTLLVICALVMIGFGLYLGTSVILNGGI